MVLPYLPEEVTSFSTFHNRICVRIFQYGKYHPLIRLLDLGVICFQILCVRWIKIVIRFYFHLSEFKLILFQYFVVGCYQLSCSSIFSLFRSVHRKESFLGIIDIVVLYVALTSTRGIFYFIIVYLLSNPVIRNRSIKLNNPVIVIDYSIRLWLFWRF